MIHTIEILPLEIFRFELGDVLLLRLRDCALRGIFEHLAPGHGDPSGLPVGDNPPAKLLKSAQN